jgi:dTMP kinase
MQFIFSSQPTAGKKREFPINSQLHLLISPSQYISDTLSKGYTIVCDRYYYSGMVYSAAKQNPNLTLEWARKPDEGLPKPDVVVFLDLDPEEAEKRGGFGDEKYENRAVQERVRQLFLSLRYGQTEEACDLVVVGAGGSVDEVARQVRAAATGQLSSVARGLLREDVMKVQGWPDGTMAAIQEAKHKASYEL